MNRMKQDEWSVGSQPTPGKQGKGKLHNSMPHKRNTSG